ncbi:MAG: ester cyclase [Mesorhizobium sp.]|nr:ester cyclase [Mesorhizobium sp.]MCO5161360.1 ester cyclase [Mesorhizobium sp.]
MTGRNDFAGIDLDPLVAERVAQFDYSGDVISTGGKGAEHAWRMLLTHTSAEWSGDVDATMATMTRNDPFQIMYGTGLNIRGWDAVRDFYAGRLQTFQGQAFEVRRWVVSDAVIIGNGYFAGTPKGVFFGVPTTGKRLCLPMTVWVHFEDGLIKGEAAYLDGHELRHQIVHGTDKQPTDEIW